MRMVNNNGQVQLPEVENDFAEIDLREMLAILLDRWLLILVITVIAVILGAIFSYMVDPVYESKAELIVEQQQSGINEEIFGSLRKSDSLANRMEIIKSPLVLNKSVEILEESGETETRFKDGQVKTNSLNETDIIQISVTGPDPEIARKSAQAVAEAYLTYSQETAREQSVAILSFLEEQIKRSKSVVETAEEAVRNYQQEIGIISLDNEAGKLNNHLTELEKQQTATEISLLQK
jgi:uncharacterized protein involved in exopolysaccharide biosynthesis